MNTKLKSKKIMDFVEDGRKEQILKELEALLLTTPSTRKVARSYIVKAMVYIKKH